jgi:PAS domain S-box-containing protein
MPRSTTRGAGRGSRRTNHEAQPVSVDPAASAETAPADWTGTILDSVADGVFTVDADWRVTSFNRAAEQITGLTREQALGRLCCEVFRADICENLCALKQTEQTGRPVINRAARILNARGSPVPISISTSLLRDGAGRVIGGVGTFRDLSVVEELRKQITRSYSVGDIICKSHSMHNVLSVLPQIAESESTVLITGESGTGKELVARALHSLSPRKDQPFVATNCAALPDTLLESELFGHVAGAFTGATRDRAGRFREAQGGTLFLDEIGDVSRSVQIRLLRVVEEREYEPVGSSKSIKADVRVVCATNKDLEALVAEGAFRQALFYRINVVRVSLPPLRSRKDDIPPLVEHFVARLNRLRGRNVVGVTGKVMSRLLAHDWPGNVRELANAIEHAFTLCRGSLLDVPCLPDHLRPQGNNGPHFGMTLDEIEAQAIHAALQRNNWKRLAAAKELSINKTTLWRKMKKLGIRAPEEED